MFDYVDLVFRQDVEDRVYGEPAKVLDALRHGPWEFNVWGDSWRRRPPEFLAARNAAILLTQADERLAQTRLNDAVARLKSLPPQIDAPCDAVAPDKAAYEELCTPDKTKLASPYGAGWHDPDIAIATYIDCLREFAAQNTGDVLWWRVRPEIRCHFRFGETAAIWRIYSRLRIGASPGAQAAEAS